MSSYLRVLRFPDFRYLFAGQAASVIGDRVVVVALALYVTRVTGSATDLGLVLCAQTLPLVSLLLFGGVWADRISRRRIMVGTDLVRGALHALLAALIFTGLVRLWEIVVIEAAFGAAQAFFQPAYTGLIPQTVPESLIQDAKALTESMANLGFLLGPALGAALVLTVGAAEAFSFDALTFFLSALLLRRVYARPRGGTEPEPVLRSLRAGWREVRSRPWVWVTIAVFAGAVLCVFAQWYALAPLIARDAYGSAGVFGLCESAAGVGAVAGAIAALRWRTRRPLAVAVLLTLGWPLQTGVFAAGAPLALVVGCSVAAGFGFSLAMIWWETALAYHIPPGALSRVSAWDWMGSLALLPLGYVVAGPLADAFGARTVLGVGSAIGVLLLAIALLPRSTRELGPDPPS
ncbi:MAG: MFS transporter [Solirubrobacterales bacterium]|nr:MFS transporter [Solirubrobacterales bacterium]MBV9715604.1 MFS transporter [Solirubrobacterales bacterium]